MGLASSLFSGISGLSTLGNSMTVIGDNIANVNTVGFKASRVTFQDVLSQTVATTAGTAQVGRGTSLADITSSFSQGSFESTDSTTDLAIGGEGFFIVRDPSNEENEYYTRAGEFRFDKDGNFTNPAGYIVKGWMLDETTGQDKGSITDIILQSFTSSPKKTDKLSAITNLNADALNRSNLLPAQWDGTDTSNVYIGENDYEYQTTLKVYDSLGSTHDVTVYFDKGATGSTYEYIVVCNPDEDNRSGYSSTDLGLGLLGKGIITFNEASGAIENITFERYINTNTDTDIGTPVVTQYGPTTPVASGTYTGESTLTYTFTVDTVGAINDSTAVIKWDNGTTNDTIILDGTAQAIEAGLIVDFGVASIIDSIDNVTWTPDVPGTEPLAGGAYDGTDDTTYYFKVTTAGDFGDARVTWCIDDTSWDHEFTPTEGLQTITGANGLTITWTADTGASDDFVLNDKFTVDCTAGDFLVTGDGFTVTCYTGKHPGNSNAYTDQTVNDMEDGYYTFQADFLGGADEDNPTTMDVKLDLGSSYNNTSGTWVNDSLSTTQYSANSTTIFQSANGYGAGDLQSITVGTDGSLTGQYSNGQVIPLYRVALAKFQNNQALFKVGGNLFRETRLSGDPITGKPGSSGLGSISPNSLEQSNVDIATEFVKMITTQRGFQANSKIITVTDQMLAELINIKR